MSQNNSVDKNKNEVDFIKLIQNMIEKSSASYHQSSVSSSPASSSASSTPTYSRNNYQVNLIGFMEFDPKSAASNSYDKKNNHGHLGSRSNWFHL